MAIYKPDGGYFPPPSDQNQRIDGFIFTQNKQTNTINRWSYPKPTQSPRFEMINGQIQRLDARWATLSILQQAAWATFFQPEWWYYFCLIWLADGSPYTPTIPSKDAYRACNISRIDQGLTIIDDPPIDTLDFTGTYAIWTAPQWSIQIITPNIPALTTLAISIYGYGTNSVPTHNEAPSSQYKYISTTTTTNYAPLDVSALLNDAPSIRSAPYRATEIRVGLPGSVPRFRARSP